MKKILITLYIAVHILFSCTSSKQVYYELPNEMLPHVKDSYAEQCNKGQALYMTNCAGCHNTRIRGKNMIPDFAPEQLKGYALRLSNAKHESNMPDSLITEEELGIIMTFLHYKKKSGIAVGVSK